MSGIEPHTEYARRHARCPVCGTAVPVDQSPDGACRACGSRPST